MMRKARELRRAKRMTLQEVADATGIGKSTLANYETGRTVMAASKIEALARCFKTTPEEVDSPVDNLHLALARESGALSVHETTIPHTCRIPADCDLPARLQAMQAQLADMAECKTRLVNVEAQLSTLLGLLGGALHHGLKDAPPRKAG